MKHVFIMNPLDQVKAHKDTSYYLMLAASELGHQVYHLDPSRITARGNTLHAQLTQVEVHPNIDSPFTILRNHHALLADTDLIWIRTDPPVDQNYIYTSLLLDLLPARVRIINRPAGIRNWNEKLAALLYSEFTPETLVSIDPDEILSFIKEHQKITLKPIDGHGGKGIEFFDYNQPRLYETILSRLQGEKRFLVQRYIPAATDGDKRILLLDGEPLGAVLRLHSDGQMLNNLNAGGSAHPSSLTTEDHRICNALQSGLQEQGIRFAGIDIIGGYLIEINVTSPTCLQEMCRFSNTPFHHQIITRVCA